jgi:hypothetical protein
MSQAIELSDEIVGEARRTAVLAQPSVAGQIEFWAQLGRAIEPLLDGASHPDGGTRPLSECLASVDSDAGRQRVRDYLQAQLFPHYEPAPNAPGLLLRTDADGTRTLGRFIGRDFQPAK